MAASALPGRSLSRSAFVLATTLPRRSYQGPLPMRSTALTCLPVPSSEALRKARQILLDEPFMLSSAMAAQSLSAPRSPAPAPISPKRRSPPNPSWLLDSFCSEARLVTKKLNLAMPPSCPVSVSEVCSVQPAAATLNPSTTAPTVFQNFICISCLSGISAR